MLVLDVLGGCPLGLNLKALKENLETKHGFDLDAFSQGLGYEDVTSCLLDIPGLGMTYHRGKQSQDCTVQLLSGGPVLPAHLLSTSHSLDKPPSSSGSNTLHQKPMERKPGKLSHKNQGSWPVQSQFMAELRWNHWHGITFALQGFKLCREMLGSFSYTACALQQSYALS